MANTLPEITGVLEESGRSVGFAALRNLILNQAGELKGEGIGLPTIVKMVLDVDRHAMAAELMSHKLKGKDEAPEWKGYQDYITGQISVEEYLKTKPGVKAPVAVVQPTVENKDGEEQRPRKKRKI